MPFENEHSGRVRRPGDFQKESFRSTNIKKGIRLIVGRLKGKTTVTAQAYRFDRKEFTAAEARKWLRDHDIDVILFEAATGRD